MKVISPKMRRAIPMGWRKPYASSSSISTNKNRTIQGFKIRADRTIINAAFRVPRLFADEPEPLERFCAPLFHNQRKGYP